MFKLLQQKKSVFIWIGAVLCPILSFYLLEWYLRNPFKTMRIEAQLLNILFYELVLFLFFGLTGQLRAALWLETGIMMIYGLANYFVLDFRSAPIMPWDIYSLKTAASVADNFQYTLDRQAILVLLLFILLLLAESRLRFRFAAKLWLRLSMAAICLLCLTGFTKMLHQDTMLRRFHLYDKLFTPTTMVYKDGTAVAFLMELRYLSVEKPAGYQSSKAAALLADYEAQAAAEAFADGKKPNIIVIMNEAFSDLSVLGDFTCNEDYMPFVHSLQQGRENTVTGNLNVSVLGGNTANTEFEFLTGHTMAFLPQGSVPYQQYLNGEAPSIASQLKSLGYHTVAMHPYHATGWERDKVYDWFGFDDFYALPDFADAPIIRKYVSDQGCYDKIIDLYEQKEEDEPLFVFNVTMQNHSSYSDSYPNFVPQIKVEGSSSDTLNNYLSLMQISDSAFQNLVNYFEAQDEETILVLFGDHQPTDSVSSPILKLHGKSHSTLSAEETLSKYKVPFVIWSNFDIPEANAVESSSNYLGAKLLELSGLPLSGYQRYLLTLSNAYPVITSQTVMSADGSYSEVRDAAAALQDYQSLQYYQLFD